MPQRQSLVNLRTALLYHVAVLVLYLLIAMLITWPLVTVMRSHLFGGFLTDAYQTARHVWWISHALQTGQPLFFQPALGYPEGLQGGWLWANPLEYFPGWLFALVMPVNTAVNAMLLTHMALNGWAAYTLARQLTRHRGITYSISNGLSYTYTEHLRAPALLAGIVFMAYPALQSRVYGGHVGVLALWPMPLALLALHMLKDSPRWRWRILAAVCLPLGIAGNSTLLVYYVMPVIGVFFGWLLIFRQWEWLRRALPSTIAGGLLMLVLLMPLALETRSTPQYNPDIGGSITYSADLLALVSPSFFHPLFERLEYPRRVLGLNLLEGTGYIGLTALAMIVVGLRFWRAARWWLALALIAWVFSMGPLLKVFDAPLALTIDGRATYVTMPWALFQGLPVFEISRTPGRFNLAVGLAAAMMAGYGAAYLWAWQPRVILRWLALIVTSAAILLEYQMFWPMPTEPTHTPAAVRALADRDDIRAVLNIPWQHRLLTKHGLYLQAYHQQPIITGQFIRDTPVSPARLDLLQDTLDPGLLDVAGVDVVIWHKEGGETSAQLGAHARAQLGEPWYEDAYLALFDVPEAPDVPGFTMISILPGEISTGADVQFYTPGPGWITLSLLLEADSRAVDVLLDGVRVHHWQIDQRQTQQAAIYTGADGFVGVRLVPNPPCPQAASDILACRTVIVHNLEAAFTPVQNGLNDIRLDHGLILRRADFDAAAVREGERLPLYLWWDLGDSLTEHDVRFVHIVGPEGDQIAGQDIPPAPEQRRSGSWMEIPEVRLPESLIPGIYRVYTGWYRYPTLERFAVQSDQPDAVNRLILLGTFETGAGEPETDHE